MLVHQTAALPLHRQRTGNGHALLLTARKVNRILCSDALVNPHFVQVANSPLLCCNYRTKKSKTRRVMHPASAKKDRSQG